MDTKLIPKWKFDRTRDDAAEKNGESVCVRSLVHVNTVYHPDAVRILPKKAVSQNNSDGSKGYLSESNQEFLSELAQSSKDYFQSRPTFPEESNLYHPKYTNTRQASSSLTRHKPIKNLKCRDPLCNQFFSLALDLLRHENQCHVMTTSTAKTFKPKPRLISM